MKTVITIISGLFLGLTSFWEAKAIFEQRRKAIFSMVCAVVSFVFVMTGIIAGAIDIALQLEAQGFVLWGAMPAVATVFLGLGVLSLATAWLTFPKPKPFTLAALGIDSEQMEQMFRQLLQQQQPQQQTQSQPPPSQPVPHPRGDTGLDQQPSFVH